jgi:outer membrane protein OmpA-like peptidoglycan-associated protein
MRKETVLCPKSALVINSFRLYKGVLLAVSDEKKIPGPPPDDFSKTTPNINLPDNAGGGQYDWDKTNYNSPRPNVSGEWGKTVTNIRPIDTEHHDYGKTMHPGASNVPEADWGMTQANVRIQQEDFGPPPSDAEQPAYDKTTPYFRLPEAERQKYQNLPPTPTEKAEKEQQEQRSKGGIPGWFWAAAGLMSMFFFAVAVLAIVYIFFIRDTSYEVAVKGAPPGSSVTVDDSPWGVTSEDGSIRLLNLKGGRRMIKIVHPTYTCESRELDLKGSGNPDPIIARCQAKKVEAGEDCSNIALGEEDKAERCYNTALDGLPDPFTPEDLVKALNILVINFASGSSEVPQVRLAALQKGAGYIKKLPPNVVLEVGGHTDNVGGDASNQALSERRAESVKAKLVQFGVNPAVLQTRGYGATQPKTSNDTEQGKFYNRRIQYSIVKK